MNPQPDLVSFEWFKSHQHKYRVQSQQLLNQHQQLVTWRRQVIECMFEAHHALLMDTPVIFMAVHFLDRFLVSRSVSNDKIKLFGLAALAIASKYHCLKGPKLPALMKFLTRFTLKDLAAAELLMLDSLDWSLTVTTVHDLNAQLLIIHRCQYLQSEDDFHRRSLLMQLLGEWCINCVAHYDFQPLHLSLACYWMAHRVMLNQAASPNPSHRSEDIRWSIPDTNWLSHLLVLAGCNESDFLAALQWLKSLVLDQHQTLVMNGKPMFVTKKYQTAHHRSTYQLLCCNIHLVKDMDRF